MLSAIRHIRWEQEFDATTTPMIRAPGRARTEPPATVSWMRTEVVGANGVLNLDDSRTASLFRVTLSENGSSDAIVDGQAGRHESYAPEFDTGDDLEGSRNPSTLVLKCRQPITNAVRWHSVPRSVSRICAPARGRNSRVTSASCFVRQTCHHS